MAVRNAGAVVVSCQPLSANPNQPCVATLMEWAYTISVTPEYIVASEGTTLQTGSDATPPSTGLPTGVLRIGAAIGSAIQPSTSRIAEIFIADRRLTEAERAKVIAYASKRYRVGYAVTTHRWSLRDVLLAANVPVTDGAAAPATIPDSVTAASVDAMAKTGAPVVRLIDPASYPRTSYGVIGFSATSCLQTADPGGVAGAAGGFSIGGRVTFTSLPGANQSIIARTNNSNAGYQVAVITSNRIALYAVNGAGTFVSAQYQLVAADTGYPRYLECVHTGSFLQIWLDGVKVAEQAIVGYTPFSGPTVVGQFGAGQPLVACIVYELNAGNTAASPSDIATAQAAFVATGKLAATPGKTWGPNPTIDVIANGGPSAGVPAIVLDRIGSDHLTTVGTGLQISQRTERLWSYETTPILQGATGFTQANFYASGVWNEPAASPWWTAGLFTVLSQSVPSGNRSLLGNGELYLQLHGLSLVHGQHEYSLLHQPLQRGGSVCQRACGNDCGG